jgi:hypothetical protein
MKSSSKFQWIVCLMALNCTLTYANPGCTSDSPCEMDFQNQWSYRVDRVNMPPMEYLGIFPLTLPPGGTPHQTYFVPSHVPSSEGECNSFNDDTSHKIKLSYIFQNGEKDKSTLNACTFGIIEACGYYWETICEQTCTKFQVFYIGLVPSDVGCSSETGAATTHNVAMQTSGYIGNTNGYDFYKSITYNFQ